MPIIKAKDISHVRISAPDLDVMERFLTDFGMVRAHRTDDRLYMRGMGPSQHIHITHKGEPGFIGFAYGARSLEDLETLSKATGAPIEDNPEPGGGKRLVLREPNGFQIEVLHGRAAVEPLPNTVGYVRQPGTPSARKGAARIVRIAHGVLATTKLQETIDWFRDHLGFIPTDDLFVNEEDNVIGSFNRIDGGDDEHVDHHVIFCLRGPVSGMHHCSFEVADVNDVFIGHDHLAKEGYEHIRGVGRHALGSQIFDYWVSPYNQMHELWSSNERFNASSGAGKVQVGPGLAHDHGPPPSERFTKQATPAPAA